MSWNSALLLPFTCCLLGCASFRNSEPMLTAIVCFFGWLPPTLLEQLFVLEAEDLDLQRPAAFDHLLLAIVSESPERKVAPWASACVTKKSARCRPEGRYNAK